MEPFVRHKMKKVSRPQSITKTQIERDSVGNVKPGYIVRRNNNAWINKGRYAPNKTIIYKVNNDSITNRRCKTFDKLFAAKGYTLKNWV